MWSQSIATLNPYREVCKIVEREIYAETFMTFKEKIMTRIRVYFYNKQR